MDLDADFQSFESAGSPGGGIHIPGNPANNISVRQNNPFNIKGNYWGAVGTGTRGFAIYPTPEAGWQAGVKQLALDHSRPFTVRQFQEKYAPTYENPTYLQDLTRMTGTSPNDPISKIPLNTLIQSIAKLESGSRGPLPGGDFRGVEKVAAKTKQTVDLDADFEAFEQQTTQQVHPGTKVSAPRLAPDVKAAYNKDFPREAPPEAPWYMRALKTAGEIAEKPGIKQALTVLNAPSKYISEPVAHAVASVIPKGTIKMAPFAESGEVSREAIDFSPKDFVEKSGPLALDFPVYGAVGKTLGWAGRALKGKQAVPPTGMPTAVSDGIDLEERIAAAASVGGSPELGIKAATKPMGTPSFLQPPTTPWVAGMTHPRLKGMTEGGYSQRTSVPGRTNPSETFPRPRVVPGINPTQYEFETARMGRPGFAPPSRMQPELLAQPLPVPMAPKPPERPWYSRGPLEDAIKAARDAKKTKALLNDIKGMKGMGHDEEVSRLLEMLGKLGGG